MSAYENVAARSQKAMEEYAIATVIGIYRCGNWDIDGDFDWGRSQPASNTIMDKLGEPAFNKDEINEVQLGYALKGFYNAGLIDRRNNSRSRARRYDIEDANIHELLKVAESSQEDFTEVSIYDDLDQLQEELKEISEELDIGNLLLD